MADQIRAFLNNVSAHWTGYLAALTAIGVVSMALLQIIKDSTPARRWYQRLRLRQWLREGAVDAGRKVNDTIDAGAGERDLITLATDGDADALLDLQIEQVAGQMNAAAQVAIAYPPLHRELFAVLASCAAPADLRLLLASAPPRQPPTGPVPGPDDAYTMYVDARTRVAQQIQRAIDAFQIATGFRWRLLMQGMSFALSAIIAYLALTSDAANTIGGAGVVSVIATALLAGYLAPIARDLQVALQQART